MTTTTDNLETVKATHKAAHSALLKAQFARMDAETTVKAFENPAQYVRRSKRADWERASRAASAALDAARQREDAAAKALADASRDLVSARKASR